MQPQQPYLVKNIDLDNILYSDIREVGSKKYIQMGYNDPKKGEQRFMYQSPEFYNVYDIKLAESGNYYELEIPLYGDQKRKITEFIKFITKTDQKNIEYGKKYKICSRDFENSSGMDIPLGIFGQTLWLWLRDSSS